MYFSAADLRGCLVRTTSFLNIAPPSLPDQEQLFAVIHILSPYPKRAYGQGISRVGSPFPFTLAVQVVGGNIEGGPQWLWKRLLASMLFTKLALADCLPVPGGGWGRLPRMGCSMESAHVS